MPQVARTRGTRQVVGTGVRPQVMEMWAIPQVVETGGTPQMGAAVASPHLGEPPTGPRVGSLLSLSIQQTISSPSSDLIPQSIGSEARRKLPFTTEQRINFGPVKSYSPSGLASHCRGPGSLGCIEVTCPPFGCPWHATYRASCSSVGLSPGSGGENLQRVQGSRHCGCHRLTT